MTRISAFEFSVYDVDGNGKLTGEEAQNARNAGWCIWDDFTQNDAENGLAKNGFGDGPCGIGNRGKLLMHNSELYFRYLTTLTRIMATKTIQKGLFAEEYQKKAWLVGARYSDPELQNILEEAQREAKAELGLSEHAFEFGNEYENTIDNFRKNIQSAVRKYLEKRRQQKEDPAVTERPSEQSPTPPRPAPQRPGLQRPTAPISIQPRPMPRWPIPQLPEVQEPIDDNPQVPEPEPIYPEPEEPVENDPPVTRPEPPANTTNAEYSRMSKSDAERQAANDPRLEYIGNGGNGWSCSSASFVNDITYATKGTSALLDKVVEKIRKIYPDFKLVVTSALGTKNSPHKKGGKKSHYNPCNVKLDFSRHTWKGNPQDLANALMGTGYFQFAVVEWHSDGEGWHIDAMFKPEALEMAQQGNL